jgi:hypothetical protein
VRASRLASLLLLLLALAGCGGGDETPAPSGDEGSGLAGVGPPLLSTENTTRINGEDAVADAAGVALAAYPPGGGKRPDAVVLVGADDWAGGVAAASLVAEPVGAPILLSGSDGVPDATGAAIGALNPAGGDVTEGRQVFAVGNVATPEGLRVHEIQGGNPAEEAAAIDRARGRLADVPEPPHILVASSEDPATSMPAASWAARSGDPVLFTGRDSVPDATKDALRRHQGLPVYVLGSREVISSEAMKEIRKISRLATRISAEDPVRSAIEFARYTDQDFGWDINDPGHGLVIANLGRPEDAGAAALLSASGKWGPLLVTDSSATLPRPLQDYLLDIKPGFTEDPTRAVYNHAFLMGDESAIAGAVQARIDDLLELTPVSAGKGP